MARIKAEYLWIDGSKPTAHLRSKTKIMEAGQDPPVWGFDGSSTLQATGESSDCVLNPVWSCPDPIRKGDNIIVMCEVLNTDMTPHSTNTRARCAELAKQHADQEMLFGLEQEYTFFEGIKPLGWPDNGFPAPQGGYYCGVGADEVFGRDVVEDHLDALIYAGIGVSGVNAEVMPAQWEFQVGPLGAPEIADQLWVARWLLYRIAEDHYGPSGRPISATLSPKPVKGDWNGAGCHTNLSTKDMRENYEACVAAAEALGRRHELHIQHYGEGVEDRLTGHHETASFEEFSYGVSNRGCSIRIPWQVHRDQKGYIEDRRPNANVEPYTLLGLVIETVCGELAAV